MEYGYVRVSSLSQNIDRQIEEMHRYNLSDKQIYIDKQSGKDFERTKYQKLKKKIKKGDLIIIKSIDRLGRNYKMILEEWYNITKKIGDNNVKVCYKKSAFNVFYIVRDYDNVLCAH